MNLIKETLGLPVSTLQKLHMEGKHYMKESRMNKVIKQLDKLKKDSPDTENILETPRGTMSVKIKDVLIYEGLNGELVLDAE